MQFQNNRMLFCCTDCILYDEGHCEADYDDRITHDLRQPHQLPTCFTFNVMDSAFAAVLEAFAEMQIDFHNADHGWPTVVGRIVSRANNYGYTNVTQRNLNKYNG